MTEERTSFLHFILSLGRSFRIDQLIDIMLDGMPVGHPLPDIPNHIIQTIVILWSKGINWGGEFITVLGGVGGGELPLIDIRTMNFVGKQFWSPRKHDAIIDSIIVRSTSGNFPFGFCGQSSMSPVTVSDGVIPGNLSDRIT
jgi:hypothetical protein